MTGRSDATSRVGTLTVLFTDLVGSTDQRVRVGEEEADRVRARHDRLARAAVLRHRGRIVKHTGDGVMATFAGASEALGAAVVLQQSIEADGRRSGRDPDRDTLRVRIGISVGDVTIESDDCFGLPVVEAQRLEATAAPGQILAASLVRALARGRGGFELRSVGALTLKGLEGPLDADEVLWSPLEPAEEVVLPPALAVRGFPFAGRTKEAELLDGAWVAVATGASRLILVAGEPGIGKTRLVAEAARRASESDGLVLAGRCDELVGVPYQPFVEALRWHVGRPGGVERLGPSAGELTRLAPELADVVRHLPPALDATPDAERVRLFDAVRAWLHELTELQPVLLVVDDLHWADTGTLLLVRHLVGNDPVPGLLIVATYRDTDLDRTHPLASMLGDLRRRSEVTRVALGGLDAQEVTDLMAMAAESDVREEGEGLAVALHEETGGNPFFVSEVLRHLVETGAIERERGRSSGGVAGDGQPALLPEGIRDVVGRRLSVLPEATQDALRVAAVIGTRFTLDVLAAVRGEDEDALLDALDPALDAHLLVESGVGSYQFAHALVRSTLHTELSTTRRARLHRRVAQALELFNPDDRDEVVADLAYHWAEAGTASSHDEAVAYARRAAEVAFARSAPEEAARWYRQARELLDAADAALEAELLFRLGKAEAFAGDARWQATLLEAARAADALGNRALMAEALCFSEHVVFIAGHPHEANTEKVALLERTLASAGDDVVLRARLSAALAVELLFVGDVERRFDLVEDVLAAAGSIEDPIERYEVSSLVQRASSYAGRAREQFDGGTERASAALSRARAAGARDVELAALADLFFLGLTSGRPDRHHVLHERDLVLEAYPHPFSSDFNLLLRMMEALVDGELAAADEVATALERQWRAHDRPGGSLYAAGGRLQTAREVFGLGVVLDVVRRIPALEREGDVPGVNGALLAMALIEAGHVDEARDLVVLRGRNDFADMPDDATLPIATSLWSEAAARVGDVRACAALYEIMRPHHDHHQVTGGWYLGSTARYLALLAAALGRSDEAAGWFAQADEAHAAVASPPWLARTRLDWAEHLEGRGESTRARELAGRALDAIGSLSLESSRARAEGLLRT